MKVQILMSTYNGEEYIRKQLDSIITQDYPVTLLIRDDGSSDGTIEIIKSYMDKYDFISLVEGENIGVIKSFFELCRLADKDADYISLADQDDIWFPDKVSRAVEKISSLESVGSKPCLYCSRQTLIDGDDKELDVKMLNVKIRPGFGNAIVENIATGCTVMVNHAMREKVSSYEPEHTIMHDWWMYLIASSMGEVYYDYEPTIYYRQHGSNTMGSRTNYIDEFKVRFKRFSGNKDKLYEQMVSYKKAYRPGGKNDEILDMVIGYKKHFSKRLKCIFSRKIYRQRKGDNLIFKLLFLTNHI